MSADSRERQKIYFAAADQARFRWQTSHRCIRRMERELLDAVRDRLAGTILEVGCGEGANLYHLRSAARRITGLDYMFARAAAAEKNVPGARAICGDAESLPVRDGAFDVVFCRDLLHHLPDAQRVVSEMMRACAPGGTVLLVESNGMNPVWMLWGLFMPAERGVLSATPAGLARLLRRCGVTSWETRYRGGVPVERIFFHYKYGLPRLGNNRAAERLFALLDKGMRLILPEKLRCYIVIAIRRTAQAAPPEARDAN